MSKLSAYTRWVAVLVFPLFVMALSPQAVHAQSTTSFDPAVNPALKGYEYNTSNGPAGEVKDTPDGKCVLYNSPGFGGGLATGCVKNGVFTLNGTVITGTEQTTQTKTDAQGNVAVSTGEDTGGGSVLDCVSNPGICFVEALKYSMGALVGGLAYVVLAIASFILWIVGGLFNWVVIKTVFQFGSTFGTSEGMLIAWGILRDIGNIVLLFSFIFMGLATILNTHALDEYSARKALPRLIIFAVLLNFSLFAAQIVIDVSNSFASVFTAQAGLSGCTEGAGGIDPETGQPAEDACANNGIAGQVIQMAGVSSVWNATDIGEFMNTPAKHAPVFIGLAIFVTVTAVVLLAAAIMLVFRAVMLCLLMVLSPIGFAGMAIPPLQEFAHSWWSQLIKNAFFAPIYLLLVLISLKIVEGLIGPNNNGSFAKAMIEGSTNAPQVFVIFAVVIAFMVASLMVANKMGGAGAKFATSNAQKLVGGAVGGSVGWIGRRTIGVGAAKTATRLRSTAFGRTDIGRNVITRIDKATEASFDPRSSKIVQSGAKAAGLDFGKPNKTVAHGIHGIEEEEVKKRVKYAGTLKQSDAEKAQEKALTEQKKGVQKSAKSREKELDAEIAEIETLPLRIERERRNAEAARAAGQTEAATKANEAVATLTKRLTYFTEAVNGQASKLDQLKQRREQESAAISQQVKQIDSAIEASRPASVYADNIAHPTSKITQVINKVSLGGHVTHEAADKIKKAGNRTDIQKALDTIKDNTEKKDDDHGDDDHGGGGGGDHKPAAGGGHAPAAGGHH